MKNKLNLKSTTALVVIIFLLGFGGTMLFYSVYKVAFMKEYDVRFNVEEGKKAGFSADPDLFFGTLPVSGGSILKKINLHNDWDIPLLLNIQLSGEASEFIKIEDNNFMLEPSESRTLSVIVEYPGELNQTGIFTGKAKVLYLRP